MRQILCTLVSSCRSAFSSALTTSSSALSRFKASNRGTTCKTTACYVPGLRNKYASGYLCYAPTTGLPQQKHVALSTPLQQWQGCKGKTLPAFTNVKQHHACRSGRHFL